MSTRYIHRDGQVRNVQTPWTIPTCIPSERGLPRHISTYRAILTIPLLSLLDKLFASESADRPLRCKIGVCCSIISRLNSIIIIIDKGQRIGFILNGWCNKHISCPGTESATQQKDASQ